MAREYKKPDPLTDESIMKGGKYAGLKMIEIPAKYLLYVHENEMCSQLVHGYVEANLEVLKKQAAEE